MDATLILVAPTSTRKQGVRNLVVNFDVQNSSERFDMMRAVMGDTVAAKITILCFWELRLQSEIGSFVSGMMNQNPKGCKMYGRSLSSDITTLKS